MKRLLAATAVFLAAASGVAAESPKLDGLWAARRDFGPDIRGALRLTSDRAEIAGRSAPLVIDHGKITFALPNGEGAFRGSIHGKRIDGFWIQPTTIVAGREFATPVTLTKRPAAWVGEVNPLPDHMTLFLSIRASSAFLRNPERNIGRFIPVHRIAIDGTHIELLAHDDTVLGEGAFDNDTLSIKIPSAGGCFDFHRATAADEAMFYPRGKSPKSYTYRKPVQLDDGWPVDSLEDVGISRTAMTKFIDKLDSLPIDSVHAPDIHAVLIARHGKLVLEEYFHGDNPDEPHDTRSAAKSLTDILIGAAKLPDTTPVYAAMHYPTRDPRKRAMTLANLLMQNSGLDCDDNDDNSPGNEDVMQSQTAQPDWYAYTLALKNVRAPGQKSVYCSCQPNLAGGVLARETKEWLPDFFREHVADPMQIRNYAMVLTPTRDAYMGGGVRLTSRDFLKLAQLMLGRGRWHGKQIVSAAWAKRSTSPLTTMENHGYGYLWYVTDYPYEGRRVRAYFAGGNGGQIAMAVPKLDLAIVFNGGNYSDRVMLLAGNVFVPEDILPAVK